MAASIESRVPFLDHPLTEWLAGLPPTMKLRGTTTKWILRQAMRGRLPAAILERRKMGFPVPVGAWLRGAWAPLLGEYVTGARTRARGRVLICVLHPVNRTKLSLVSNPAPNPLARSDELLDHAFDVRRQSQLAQIGQPSRRGFGHDRLEVKAGVAAHQRRPAIARQAINARSPGAPYLNVCLSPGRTSTSRTSRFCAIA